MEMSMGQRLRQSQRLGQSLRFSQEQRLLLQSHCFNSRLALIKALRDEEYKPKAKCPSCGRELTPVEILKGFNQDPNDFTTGCSGCGHRFEPRLVCLGDYGTIELPFWCDSQTLARLRGLESLSPLELSNKHPAVYRSAIIHHGGFYRAFEKIGINYPFEEISDWKEKITPFFGRLPDTIIAECVNVSARVIRRIRQKLGISRYTLRQSLEEIEG